MRLLKKLLFIIAFGCGLLASISIATIQKQSQVLSEACGSIKTCPEDIEFAEGRITQFAPYFNSATCTNPDGELRRHTPLASEGVEVTIEFENTQGDRQSFNETWLLPTYDHFKVGDSVDLFWEKALVTKPRSVIKDELKLRHAAQNGQRGSAADPELREKQIQKISRSWHEHALLFKQCEAYHDEYCRDKKAWRANTVKFNRLGKTAADEYQTASRKRLVFIRQQLETVSTDR